MVLQLPKAFVNIILMGGLAVGRALVGAYKEALASIFLPQISDILNIKIAILIIFSKIL